MTIIDKQMPWKRAIPTVMKCGKNEKVRYLVIVYGYQNVDYFLFLNNNIKLTIPRFLISSNIHQINKLGKKRYYMETKNLDSTSHKNKLHVIDFECSLSASFFRWKWQGI